MKGVIEQNTEKKKWLAVVYHLPRFLVCLLAAITLFILKRTDRDKHELLLFFFPCCFQDPLIMSQ